MTMILAGDIGGTKTVLALFRDEGGQLREVASDTFPSQAHSTFDGILREFLSRQKIDSLESGVFGVAGAVIDGRSRTTNLPWTLDERTLAKTIGAPRVKLLNDLEAAAYGVLFLRDDELFTISAGALPRNSGNVAVIAAGTGLGEAFLYWDGGQHHPLASEGGHADFAARTDLEIDLLKYLRQRLGGHVSYERVLSGPGFLNIYEFLRDTGRHAEPPWLAERIAAGNPNEAISAAAIELKEPLAAATLEMFCEAYGAEAGNLALKVVATGGVYVAGGIAPKLLPGFHVEAFLRGFYDKGRFAGMMKSLCVSIVTNPRVPLIGAAHYGLRFR
jgi:glucokinase